MSLDIPASAISRISNRFWKKVNRLGPDDCWNWTGFINRYGYGTFGLNLPNRKRVVTAHRLSHEINIGPVGGFLVMHSCDNRACVNPSHLRLGSNLENMRDRLEKGRYQAVSRVTCETRSAVIAGYLAGLTITNLSQEHGIDVKTVRNILRSFSRTN